MKRVERKLLGDLEKWQGSKRRLPLIVRGARQVGKTFLLKEFGVRSFCTTHYFNFEAEPGLKAVFAPNLNPHRILAELALTRGAIISKDRDLVIFDEIQECPLALTSLKYFAEDTPELALCCAGSLLGLELASSSFPVGKVNYLEMHPLTFEEFVLARRGLELYNILRSGHQAFSNLIHQQLWEEFLFYMITGGLPEIVSLFISSDQNSTEVYHAVRHRQSEIVLSHMADMAKHCGKENAMHLERLWKNVPEQLAQSLDGTAKKFVFKNAVAGLRSYQRLAGPIDWLNKAALISTVKVARTNRFPLSAYSKESEFKLYMYDVGILGLMAGLDPLSILSWRFGGYKGFFAENFVAQELVARGFSPYTWKEKAAEIEFLVESKGTITPIEVKSGAKTRSRSLNTFLSRYPNTKGIVLSGSGEWQEIGRKLYRPLYLIGSMAITQ